MILYLDTSALVKLFADEPGAAGVREAVQHADFRACHLVGYAEACAALARRARVLGLSLEDIEKRVSELGRVWTQLDVVGVDWPLVRRAGELAVRFQLRGYDSIHLAAAEALWIQVRGAAEFRFAVFDRPLGEAAGALGIDLLAA